MFSEKQKASPFHPAPYQSDIPRVAVSSMGLMPIMELTFRDLNPNLRGLTFQQRYKEVRRE